METVGMERWMNSSLFPVTFMVADDFSRFLTMAMDMFCGDFSVTTHNTKKRAMSRHILRLPRWHDIDQICIGLI